MQWQTNGETYSEEWRNECEARDLLTWSLAARRKQLALVLEKRGEAGYYKLTQEILRQWNMTRTKQSSTSLESPIITQEQKQIDLI
jgi:hypothetical protein